MKHRKSNPFAQLFVVLEYEERHVAYRLHADSVHDAPILRISCVTLYDAPRYVNFRRLISLRLVVVRLEENLKSIALKNAD